MINLTSPEVITHFLKRVKKLISQKRGHLWPRPENEQALIDLMICQAEMWTLIQGLTFRDYVSGPKEDDNKTRGLQCWEFSLDIDNLSIGPNFPLVYPIVAGRI